MTDFMRLPLDSAAASAPLWLQDYLREARSRWEGSTLPTRKTEEWKYTGLQALRVSYAAASEGVVGLAEAGVELPHFGGYRLVFINGRYCAEHTASPEMTAGKTATGLPGKGSTAVLEKT